MKRLLLWILVVCFILSCSYMGTAEDKDPNDSIIIEKLSDATDEELNKALQKIYTEMQSRKGSNILVDDEYITAEFLGFDEYQEMCFYVNMNITNKTDKPITIMLDDASVNNESLQLVMTGVPVTVLSGQTGKGAFIFSYMQLSIDSLTEVNEVSFRISIVDESTMNTIEKTESVSVINH